MEVLMNRHNEQAQRAICGCETVVQPATQTAEPSGSHLATERPTRQCPRPGAVVLLLFISLGVYPVLASEPRGLMLLSALAVGVLILGRKLVRRKIMEPRQLGQYRLLRSLGAG